MPEARIEIEAEDGCIDALAAWPDGEAQGLKARGGWTVGMKWKAGRLTETVLDASLEGACRLRVHAAVKVTCEGQAVAVTEAGDRAAT